MIESLPELLARRAVSDAKSTFVQDVDGDVATYADAVTRANTWAGALAGLGLDAGDTVATMVGNCVESVLCWIGIATLSAIEAPVHPAFTGYMLEHAINTAGARIVITEPARLAALCAALPQLPNVRTIIVLGDAADAMAPGNSVDVVSADALLAAAKPLGDAPLPGVWDTAAVIYTSGTTGPSKGVVVPWGAIAAAAKRTFPFDDLGADDVIYVFTPASHVGSKILPYLAALIGGTAIMRADFKIGEFLADIRRFGITTTPAVGAIPHFLVQMPESPDDADIPLRNMVMAPLVPGLDAFRERFGVRICTAYNMTELSIPFASEGWRVDNHLSVGKVLGGWPGVQVRLVDEHDQEVAIGDVGELIVRTDEPWTMNVGYFGMAEATASAWRNGWFHTGDAFKCDADGYYYFVDRMKDAIRRRGENISSFEVEAIVNMHESVLESAAVAVAADTAEDEVKVFVVARPGETIAPDVLTAFLIDRMPAFMVPRFVEFIDELPKTVGTMRVKKEELRALGQSDRTWDRSAH